MATPSDPMGGIAIAEAVVAYRGTSLEENAPPWDHTVGLFRVIGGS